MTIGFLTADMIGFLAVFGFVFALVFALMIYAKIFIESRKAVALIAAVIGLVTAVYEPAVIVLTSIIPIAAIVFVFVFFIVFIQKIFFPEKKDAAGNPIKRTVHDVWPSIVCLGIMMIILNVTWDKLSGYIGLATIPGETVLWSVGILIVLLIFIIAYSVWGES